MGRYKKVGSEEMKIWVLPEQRERLKKLAQEISPEEPKIRYVLEVFLIMVDTQPSVWRSAVNRWKSMKKTSMLF
ncbi:MAG: hypothetical protein QXL22_01065 [Candidatus Nezhaarchaeales archaeon]